MAWREIHMSAKAKTINLLLEDGTLNGVISIEDSSWNSGELYSAPRNSVDDLIASEACSKFGVYLLISDEKVYVGQSSDLSKRIKQHKIGKDWWEQVIILTTISDSLNRSDIDYLESVLIEKASDSNRLDCDNKSKGNKQKVTRFRKVELDQWLEEALLLMELIGVTVFSQKSKRNIKKQAVFNTVDTPSKQKVEIRAKQYAVKYLEEQGVSINKPFSYAKRQDNREMFWINPKTSFINIDWNIVLNNQVESVLLVLEIPAGTFKIRDRGETGLFVRKDKPDRIDLEINSETLVDERSKYDFGKFVKKKIAY